MSKNIFEHNYGGQLCFSIDAVNRIADVNRCNDIQALEDAKRLDGMQKSVVQAIDRRIKKLGSW